MNILTAGRLMFAKKLALNLIMSVAIGLALFFCNMLICNFNGILQANAPTYFYQDETLYFQPMRIYLISAPTILPKGEQSSNL